MKFVKKNNIWYKHNNNSDKLYNFFHGWTNYDSINDIEEEFENWHDLYKKTGWHPFITDSKERNVWISPWGEYFSCNAHYLGAEKIIEVIYGIKEVDYADDYLVERRWVKGTTSLMWDMFYADMEYCITEKTKNAILKYCYTHNLRLPVDFKIVDDYKVENPNAKFYEDIKCHTLENKNIYEKH